MKDFTFRLFDNFLPNPKIIPTNNIIVNFKYCNISELSWIDKDYNDYCFLLPSWVEYFDLSYNTVYDFYKGESHNYELPKSLKILNLSFNKLTFIPDEIPKTLYAINVSNNSLKLIPKLPLSTKIINASHNTIKWFDQELPNLTKLNLSYNHIYYFRFDRLCDNLRFLDLSGNQLKFIDGDSFPKNVKILKIADNRIKEIPELPEGIEEFDCHQNEIVEIKNFPSSLKKLDISDNKIEVLGKDIINCSDLESLNYEKNENLEVDVDVLQWIDDKFHQLHLHKDEISRDNIKDIYNQNHEEIITVYKDSQNAHNLKIRQDIISSMEKLLVLKPQLKFEECVEELSKYFKLEDTKDILLKSDIGFVSLLDEKYSLSKFFPYLFERIKENIENIAIILEGEIQNTKNVCFSGRIEAYVASLAGFCQEVQYSASISDQILAKIELIKNKLHQERIPVDSFQYQLMLKYKLEDMLVEMDLDEETKLSWLEPLEENIQEQKEKLEEHYGDKIENIVKRLKIKKEIRERYLINT